MSRDHEQRERAHARETPWDYKNKKHPIVAIAETLETHASAESRERTKHANIDVYLSGGGEGNEDEGEGEGGLQLAHNWVERSIYTSRGSWNVVLV